MAFILEHISAITLLITVGINMASLLNPSGTYKCLGPIYLTLNMKLLIFFANTILYTNVFNKVKIKKIIIISLNYTFKKQNSERVKYEYLNFQREIHVCIFDVCTF